MHYQFNDNKKKWFYHFQELLSTLQLPDFPLAFFNVNLDKCPDSLVTAGY